MENWKTKRSLKVEVYSNLKEAILNGQFEDDMSITQRLVEELYGVSGTPFREAVQILESEGLVYALPNKGVYVSPVTFKNIKEVLQIRAIFETGIAKIVTEDFDEKKYEELNDLIKQLNTDSNEQSIVKFTNLDHEFHRKLIEYTENNQLMSMNTQIYDMMRRMGNIVLTDVKRREHVIKEHSAILAGLENGNAEEPIIDHLNSVQEHMRKYYK